MEKVSAVQSSWHTEGGGWWATFYIYIFFSFNLCFVLLFPLMMLFVSDKQLIKQHPFSGKLQKCSPFRRSRR